jgi:hypothetical protein
MRRGSRIHRRCACRHYLALGDMTTDFALRAIGVERYLWAIEHPQQLGLTGVQPRE